MPARKRPLMPVDPVLKRAFGPGLEPLPTMEADPGGVIAELLACQRTLSPGVKTRNVGTCQRCGKPTSSGMDPRCHRCAVDGVARLLPQLASAFATLRREVLNLTAKVEEGLTLNPDEAAALRAAAMPGGEA